MPLRPTTRTSLETRRRTHRLTIRRIVFKRAGGCCELQHRPDCVAGVLAWDGLRPVEHGHLAPVRGTVPWPKRVRALLVNGPELYAWGCWRCALLGPKRGSGRGKALPAELPKNWSDDYYGN